MSVPDPATTEWVPVWHPCGIPGPAGPAGPAGSTGPGGPTGPAGTDGTDGTDGADGAMGPAGPQGIQGVPGEDGPIGPTGPPGADGVTPALLETFITVAPETGLANSRQLVAGTNVTLDTATPGEIAINATGGGGGGMDLAYLGDYVPGTYDDGDIVIGADGIAYMCVVDGTTTPPEPWPGVPVDPPVIFDATYWVVAPHAGLVNARVLASLANGYVKSTAGEPSTIAVIPLAEGGTGATDASTARTNLGLGTVSTINLNGNVNTFLNGVGGWSTPSSIPSGLIAMFAVACPPGWTRLATMDGRFPRAMPTFGGVGGVDTHSHTVSGAVDSHAHGAAGLTIPAHNHPGSTTDLQGIHGHTGSVSGDTGVESAGVLNADAGSSGNVARSNHHHFVNLPIAVDTNGEHGHNLNIALEGGNPVQGATAAAAPGFSGSSNLANHTPYYFDAIFCQKD